MSPMKRASAVDGLRRAAAVPAAAAPKIRNGVTDLPAEVSQRPRAEKPVRFTLDLDRAHHQFLKEYAVRIEAKGASEVMRALLDELRDDAELAGRVRARVWGTNR
jgi:hypothetical protein